MRTTSLSLRVREEGAVEPDVHGSSNKKVWILMELGWEVEGRSQVLLVQSLQLGLDPEP